MTFTLKLLIAFMIFWIMLPLIHALLICGVQALEDPIYQKLKPKGKIKYFISQLLEVEF